MSAHTPVAPRSLGDLPWAAAPAPFASLGRPRVSATGAPGLQGRSEAPRRQGGKRARGERALPAAAHVPDWRCRQRPGDAFSSGAGAQPGGRAAGGQRLNPDEPARASQQCAQRSLPTTPGSSSPTERRRSPQGSSKAPLEVPVNFLG